MDMHPSVPRRRIHRPAPEAAQPVAQPAAPMDLPNVETPPAPAGDAGRDAKSRGAETFPMTMTELPEHLHTPNAFPGLMLDMEAFAAAERLRQDEEARIGETMAQREAEMVEGFRRLSAEMASAVITFPNLSPFPSISPAGGARPRPRSRPRS